MVISKAGKTIPKRASSIPDFRDLADRFALVSDATRLRVVLLLGERGRSVGELNLAASASTTPVSAHLTFMRLRGAVAATQIGTSRIYGLTEAGRELFDCVSSLCDMLGSGRVPDRERPSI
jgi:hypothetical protein